MLQLRASRTRRKSKVQKKKSLEPNESPGHCLPTREFMNGAFHPDPGNILVVWFAWYAP
jgi:hypothetical protein